MLFAFEKLNAYIEARKLVITIYNEIKAFPIEERYALCDQIRRSAISVTSNIAEGTSRSTLKDKIHFVEIAFSSLMELLSQSQVALDLEYITESKYTVIRAQINIVAQLLSGLRRSYQNELKTEH
ncbi:MAG: four helix bundle protein [Bacteroidaceae bacterium]|nr:four helix bundle protein [Bacteroidaceae bacterium]